MQVDTLFVLTPRTTAVAADLLSGLRWACQGSYHVICVAPPEVEVPPGVEVLRQPAGPPGFLQAAAVQQAGVQYLQSIWLSHDCLITGQGLDRWALAHTQKPGLGVIGVQDRRAVREAFRTALPFLHHWGLPHTLWENPPMTLTDAVLVWPAAALQRLQAAGWLLPAQWAQWPVAAASYYAWAVQMARMPAVAWGFMDRPLPPLFVGYAENPLQPAPVILSTRFLLYAPVTRVPGYTEAQLRAAYARVRGEPAPPYPPFGPVVSSPPR